MGSAVAWDKQPYHYRVGSFRCGIELSWIHDPRLFRSKKLDSYFSFLIDDEFTSPISFDFTIWVLFCPFFSLPGLSGSSRT